MRFFMFSVFFICSVANAGINDYGLVERIDYNVNGNVTFMLDGQAVFFNGCTPTANGDVGWIATQDQADALQMAQAFGLNVEVINPTCSTTANNIRILGQ